VSTSSSVPAIVRLQFRSLGIRRQSTIFLADVAMSFSWSAAVVVSPSLAAGRGGRCMQ
jgi:hypothetical protein